MIGKCPSCGTWAEDPREPCPRCGTSLPKIRAEVGPVVQHRIFRGVLSSWEQLCTQAAEFATQVGRERLITICHSEDGNDGVVVVWFWQE